MDEDRFYLQAFLTGCVATVVGYAVYLLATYAGVWMLLVNVIVYAGMGFILAFFAGAFMIMIGGMLMLLGMIIQEAFRKPVVELSDQLELPFD